MNAGKIKMRIIHVGYEGMKTSVNDVSEFHDLSYSVSYVML